MDHSEHHDYTHHMNNSVEGEMHHDHDEHHGSMEHSLQDHTMNQGAAGHGGHAGHSGMVHHMMSMAVRITCSIRFCSRLSTFLTIHSISL